MELLQGEAWYRFGLPERQIGQIWSGGDDQSGGRCEDGDRITGCSQSLKEVDGGLKNDMRNPKEERERKGAEREVKTNDFTASETRRRRAWIL